MSLLSTFSKAAAGLALAAGLMATAIPATAMAAGPYTKDNPLKVVLVVHGTLGDKSFFDSAAAGLHQAEKDLPISLKIIEATSDRSKWEPALDDAADGGYDVVIAGTFQGEIRCEQRVDLLPQSKVTGDINTKVFIVHEGATLDAAISMTGENVARQSGGRNSRNGSVPDDEDRRSREPSNNGVETRA